MTRINTIEDFSQILESQSAIVYFSSPFCGVCGTLKPKVANLSQEFSKTSFFEVDISLNQQIAAQYSVFSAPTVLVFFEGKESIRLSRIFSLDDLQSKLRRFYEIVGI